MTLKPGVKFGSKEMAMAFAIVIVNSIFVKHGYDCVVTSVNDGSHMDGSKHYLDEAFDVRTKNIPDVNLKKQIASEIKTALGELFDVILEYLGGVNEHLHIEIH